MQHAPDSKEKINILPRLVYNSRRFSFSSYFYYSHNETVQKLSKYQKSGDSDISSVSYDNTISLKLSSHSRSSKLLDDRVSVPSDKR